MTETFSPSAACAEFAASLAYGDIPAEAIDRIKRDILDWTGCAIRGSVDKASNPIREVAGIIGGPKQSGIFGAPFASDMRTAAMMNAWYSHIMEMDDVDRASISHPASCIFPAVLALAGTHPEKTGRDMIAASVAGFEVMLRIGASVTPGHYKVFHTTATTGVFGSAAACSNLLGFDAHRTGWAIGNAGTSACGLWQFNPDGAMSKFIHTGYAASNGLLVALLAEHGFTGAAHILEGEQGFFKGYARQDVDMAFFQDFGQRWRSAEFSFKPYPCCRHTHSAIDAGLAIRAQLHADEKIESLQLFTYNTALNIAGKTLPASEREAKFSISYCVASSIVRGMIKQTDFEPAALQDETVLDLQRRITTIDDPAINGCVPKNWPCRIEAQTSEGRTVTAQIQSPTGDPESDISWEGLEDKFRLATEGVLSAGQQSEMIDICRNFETLSNLDAGNLFEIANRNLR